MWELRSDGGDTELLAVHGSLTPAFVQQLLRVMYKYRIDIVDEHGFYKEKETRALIDDKRMRLDADFVNLQYRVCHYACMHE